MCKEKKIEWYGSAWDLQSQEFLRKFDCKYNKIASAMIISHDLLKEVASEGKHTFISTGMTEEKDIDIAVKIFKDANCEFTLLHCVSTYPMEDEDANLNAIKALRDKYNCDVGYSGHEEDLDPSIVAISLGAKVLERHVTLDRNMWGSDQKSSIEPSGLIKSVSYTHLTLPTKRIV